MSSLNLVRWGALGALLAGATWIASFFVDLGSEGPGSEILGLPSFYLVEGLIGLALTATLVGLLGLHARQSTDYGILGTAGFLAALAGTALVLANVLLSRVAERNVLDLLLLLGLLGMLLGFVLLGIAMLRARVLPTWCGVALIFVLPVAALLGDLGGGLVFGLVWLGLGYALLAARTLDRRSRREPF